MALTRLLKIRISEPLYEAIEREAKRDEQALSAVARRTLRRVHLPDRATLEIPANRAILTDEPVPYEVEE